MTEIPLFAGITTDGNADFRTAYPVNMVPVPMPQGISAGYLRPADGIKTLTASNSAYPDIVTNGDFALNITGWTAYNNASLSHSATEGGRLQFSASSPPELITNGEFTTDINGWTVNSGTSVSHDAGLGGRALFSQSSGAFQSIYQEITTEAGVDYTALFEISLLLTGAAIKERTYRILVEDVASGDVLLDASATGTPPVTIDNTYRFVAINTTTRITIGIVGNTADDYQNALDSVSVKETFNKPGAYQDLTTEAAKRYKVTFDQAFVASATGTVIQKQSTVQDIRNGYIKVIDVASGEVLLDQPYTATAGQTVSKEFTFVATGTNTRLIIGVNEDIASRFPAYLDNVVCRVYFDATSFNRGGINWEGELYRVIGTDLYSVASDGSLSVIGTIGGTGRVRMTYSFTHLAIASSDQLWLYDGTTLAQVTDVDLGDCKDVIFIDGYFMITDGEFLVVTELNDPFSVDPLKYGSSEINPDPILALLKVRNEAYAMNRYTIEVFANVGTSGFPFQRIPGAQIEKGVIGRDACAVFLDQIVFVGSGFNETVSIYIAAKGGGTVKISSREIDDLLAGYTEAELQNLILTTRIDRNHKHLHVRLPDGKTLVFDQAASEALQTPIWFELSSDLTGGEYRATDLIYCYDQWNVADTQSNDLGYLTPEVSTHWGNKVRWEFTTLLLYNDGRGAIVHELELVALTGRTPLGQDPRISAEYSLDGISWSQPKTITAGKQGDRQKRLRWLSQGKMHNFRGQRFRGNSDAFMSIARLEARLEPLAF